MCWKTIYNFFADFGDWLSKIVRNKNNAIILVILSFFSPLGFIFAVSFIASLHRKKRK